MGIEITFHPTRIASSAEMARDRLKVCYEAIRFFQSGLFFPQDIEVWFTAPSEALGGTLAKSIVVKNLYADVESLYEYLNQLLLTDLSKTIVVFNGKWAFSGIELGGYFSIQNNNEWRTVYGDISISAYARGEFEDLTDGLWSVQDPRHLIVDFVKNLVQNTKNLSIGLAQINFSRGIFSEEDPTNLMAIYLSGERRSLLRIFYKALVESKDPAVVLKAQPLSSRFLIETLISKSIVKDRIDRRLEKDLVAEIPTRSALYIAKERESFAKLYADISEAVLKPALKKLPEAKLVEYQIEEGLKEFRDSENL